MTQMMKLYLMNQLNVNLNLLLILICTSNLNHKIIHEELVEADRHYETK